MFQPKLLGRPSLKPARLGIAFVGAAQLTLFETEPKDVVFAALFLTTLSSRARSVPVLANIPAAASPWHHRFLEVVGSSQEYWKGKRRDEI